MTVFTVAIADDEPLIIKGLLKMVDWEKLNTKIVGSAKHGEALIRLIDELAPDIIISDISMPRKSGIDVIKYINEKKLKTKVIFLSAYQEFDYAKQALKYGAIEYLLKPVTQEELEKAVIKAERILEDNLSLEFFQEDKKSIRTVFKTLTTEYEYNDLYSNFEEIGVPVSGAYYIGVCFSVVSKNEAELLRFTVFKKIEEYFKNKKTGFCLKRESNFCNMVLFYSSREGFRAEEIVQDIMVQMKKNYGVKLIAGIGKEIDDLVDLKYAYKTSAFSCNLYYFKQQDMIFYDTIDKDYNRSFDDYNQAYENLVRAVLVNDKGWVDKLLLCLDLIGELHYGNRGVAENRCVSMLMELFRELNNYITLNETCSQELERFVSGIRNMNTYQKVKLNITQFLPAFMEKNVFPKIGNENETIKNVKMYIRDKYFEEISLKAMSTQFFMNQYYFSTFFKQKTGMNFKDYLVEVRMHKAMEFLLADGEMNTQELALRVGYHDAKTFSEKFKQYYGESPVNYKKIKRK